MDDANGGSEPEGRADRDPRLALDTSIASSARMYDYFLGGKDNFAVDREAAARMLEIDAEIPRNARANRRFLARAVRYLAEQGLTQFIDLGSGIPTSPNVHEIVQTIRPEARIVYVDNDPVVTIYNRALNATREKILAVQADIRRPANIWNDPAVGRTIDFTRPIAVLLVSMLHFFDDTDADHILASVRSQMPPGSHLVISTATSDGGTAEETQAAEDVYARSGVRIVPRPYDAIAAYFTGYELLAPGLVPVQRWRADEPTTRGTILAGIGRVP